MKNIKQNSAYIASTASLMSGFFILYIRLFPVVNITTGNQYGKVNAKQAYINSMLFNSKSANFNHHLKNIIKHNIIYIINNISFILRFCIFKISLVPAISIKAGNQYGKVNPKKKQISEMSGIFVKNNVTHNTAYITNKTSFIFRFFILKIKLSPIIIIAAGNQKGIKNAKAV